MVVRPLLAALCAVLVTACGGPQGGPSLTIGSAEDDVSLITAHLYAAALRYYGTATRVEPTADPLTALDAGDVAVVPGLTGRLLARFQPDATARADEQVYRDMVSALPEGIAAGDYTTAAEDKPALAVTESTVADMGGQDLSALVRRCGDIRPGRVRALRTPAVIGTCRLRAPREFPDTATLFAAVQAGAVNAAWTTTAAPGIPPELVVLADRTSLVRAENVVPLYRRNTLEESQILALNEVAGVLDTAALAQMRARVADGADPAAVAGEWLANHPLRD
ncbi:glycine betaine ABC transporter substrate-binding protein [Mycolicibacterium baixiangningiae]|uniref:glycine betaine ABC transporter substrate-binding protein n=1 Tax=Mycolicibacterium baixiangningiae TaxID=2761578 RepID=UPI0018D00463|nr:glycine betaine ABC transporter substrate-binding protein [Mycolicibacterium baixiangningiae]